MCHNFPAVFFFRFFRDIETERKWEVSCSSITLTETSNSFYLSIVLQLLQGFMAPFPLVQEEKHSEFTKRQRFQRHHNAIKIRCLQYETGDFGGSDV